MENNISSVQPYAPQTRKKSKKILYITIAIGLVVGLVGYLIPLGGHLSSEFCSTRAYGFPLKIQDRLVIEQVSLQNPTNITPRMLECLHGSSYPNVKSGDIEWVNWIINIVITVVSFGAVGYLAMRTNKLGWLFLLILLWVVIWFLGRYFQANTASVVTG